MRQLAHAGHGVVAGARQLGRARVGRPLRRRQGLHWHQRQLALGAEGGDERACRLCSGAPPAGALLLALLLGLVLVISLALAAAVAVTDLAVAAAGIAAVLRASSIGRLCSRALASAAAASHQRSICHLRRQRARQRLGRGVVKDERGRQVQGEERGQFLAQLHGACQGRIREEEGSGQSRGQSR